MSGTAAPLHDDLPPWLQRKLRRAWMVLLWERTWAAAWPLASLIGLFLAISLIDGLPLLPEWVHVAILGLFGVTVTMALVYAIRSVTLPSQGEAARRLETASDAPHRPLTALFDHPVGGSGLSELWEIHVARMSVLAQRLDAGWPSPVVPARDPLGLRAVVVLLLVIGVVVGWGHAGERLQRALSPAFAPPVVAENSVQIWITPPGYTGIGPIVLGSITDPDTLAIPIGSAVLAQVQGGREAPLLDVNGRSVPFAALGETSYRLETAIDGGDALVVRQGGRTLAQWTMTVIPDHPPTIGFASKPVEGGRWRLKFDLNASDDYGVVAIGTLIGRADGTSSIPSDVPLPLPGAQSKAINESNQIDLTAHPLAGQEVNIRLYARDGSGQTSVSDAVQMRLPERKFLHPVARAIAAQRMALAITPERLVHVLIAIDDLSEFPETFGGDSVVFLGLRLARLRLLHNRSNASVEAVRELLWQLAVRLEDGSRAEAEREEEDAGRALALALSQGDAVDSAELEALIERYRLALNRTLEALSQELAKLDPNSLPMPEGSMVRAEDFGQLLDRLRDMARAGALDAARQMLADLQRSMQDLHSARIPRPDDKAMQEARAAMEALKALIDRQQALLDDTFEQSQSTHRTVDHDRMEATAHKQNALRLVLGDMMQRLSDTGNDLPEGFGKSELAMRRATADLMNGDPTDAAESEGVALHELKESTRATLQKMIQRMVGQSGPALFPSAGGDPLGRYDDGVHVPSQSDTQNARRILDELRRRAGEQTRPQQERDYLNRLLRQF